MTHSLPPMALDLEKKRLFYCRGDIAHFEYLSMVVKESLRLHNPVLSIGRNLDKPFTIKSAVLKKMETVLPKKMDVNVHLSALSGNPHVWKNPKVCCVVCCIK